MSYKKLSILLFLTIISHQSCIKAMNPNLNLTLIETIERGDLLTTKILLDQGASLDISNGYGYTPLHYAVRNIDMLKLLLRYIPKNNERLNRQNESGETPLHYAYDKRESLIALLEHGANPLIKDNLGRTVRDIIKDLVNIPHLIPELKNKYLAIDKLLQKWEHQFIQTLSQPLIAQIAIQPTNFRETKQINSVTLSETKKLILDAVIQGDSVTLTKLLTDNTIDINKIPPYGSTYLHFAIMNKQITTAQILINRGASLEIQDDLGDTPLHLAAIPLDTNILKLLLSYIPKNSELLNRQNLGATPLHYAHNNQESLIALLEHGANPLIKDNLGETVRDSIKGLVNYPHIIPELKDKYLAIDKLLQKWEHQFILILSQPLIAQIAIQLPTNFRETKQMNTQQQELIQSFIQSLENK